MYAAERVTMPTVEEVCSALNVIDIPIEYSEADLQHLISYKAFAQHVRPILQRENPKTPAPKVMMLVAAKWREFCDLHPNLQNELTATGTTSASTSSSSGPAGAASAMVAATSARDDTDDPRSSRSSRNEKVRHHGFMIRYKPKNCFYFNYNIFIYI